MKQRLETEITDEMRKNNTLKEIEALENKIQKEVELHYNKFDENELSYNYNNNNNNNNNSNNSNNKTKNGRKHSESWISPREMISILGCEAEVPSSTLMEKLQFKSRIAPNRIRRTLVNVKCLQFEPIQHQFSSENLIEEIALAH